MILTIAKQDANHYHLRMDAEKPNSQANSLSEPSGRNTPEYRVETLMQGGRRLVLQHGKERYVLSVTRSGKLILTK